MTIILASLVAQVPEVLGMARGHGLLREGRGDGEWAQLPQVLGMARGHGLEGGTNSAGSRDGAGSRLGGGGGWSMGFAENGHFHFHLFFTYCPLQWMKKSMEMCLSHGRRAQA